MDPANNGSGGWIYVIVVNVNDWSLTPCGSSSQACTSGFPQNGYPPYFVYMKSKPFSSCDWSLEAFAAVLVHELGHSLGLTHPNQGVHIAGTEACVPGSDGICRASSPGYSTVMSPTAFRFDGGICRLVNTAMIFPQSDDFASIQALYP
jgi:hypothetical protein